MFIRFAVQVFFFDSRILRSAVHRIPPASLIYRDGALYLSIRCLFVAILMLGTVLALAIFTGSHAHAQSIKSKAPKLKEASPKATKTVYRNVQLIDSQSAKIRKEIAVVVEGDRIISVLPQNRLSRHDFKNANIVEGEAAFMIPGLIDMHVHLDSMPTRKTVDLLLKRHLYGGITAIRDMAGDARILANVSRDALIHRIPAPDIFYSAMMAGPSFYSDPRTHAATLGVKAGNIPWMQAITNESDLSLAVAQAKGSWASGIKVYANLSSRLVQNIIHEAKRQDIPVWTHLQVYPATPFDSIGAHTVSHVCMIARHILEPNKQSYGHANPPNYHQFSFAAPEFQRYIKALADSNTILDATLGIYPVIGKQTSESTTSTPTGPRCPQSFAVALLKTMHRAGVKITSGTDINAPPSDPFPALFAELTLLSQEVGMNNYEVLLAATLNAAIGLGKQKDLGSVSRGKLANFVLLKKNPIKDIANLRSVVLTVKRGKPYPRKNYVHSRVEERPVPE